MIGTFAAAFVLRILYPIPAPERSVPLETRPAVPLLTASNSAGGDVAMATSESDVESASVDEIKERLDSLKTLYRPSQRTLMRRLLIGRWLELDPGGAFAWCRDDCAVQFYSASIISNSCLPSQSVRPKELPKCFLNWQRTIAWRQWNAS